MDRDPNCPAPIKGDVPSINVGIISAQIMVLWCLYIVRRLLHPNISQVWQLIIWMFLVMFSWNNMQTKQRTYDISPNDNICFPVGTILAVQKDWCSEWKYPDKLRHQKIFFGRIKEDKFKKAAIEIRFSGSKHVKKWIKKFFKTNNKLEILSSVLLSAVSSTIMRRLLVKWLGGKISATSRISYVEKIENKFLSKGKT